MKSNFSQVVRVKKQLMDKMEARLVSARLNVQKIELDLKKARDRLDEFQIPKSGNAGDLRGKLELLKMMRDELISCKERLGLAKKEVVHFEHQYKNANLEYEKMKYLEKEDFKREVKRIQRAEVLALDEFAVMKFAVKDKVSDG
ncbi:MAG: flagellar export protein FliJ [Campylobacter sp.]|nr:flagellar export protein FliJ [Campylobacter sp.]